MQFASGALTPYYAPADTIINTFTCPSDIYGKEKGVTASNGAYSARINLQTCLGDSVRMQTNARGLFTWDGSGTVTTAQRDDGSLAARLLKPMGMDAVTDGSSNTLLVSECVTTLNPGGNAVKGGVRNYAGIQVLPEGGVVDPETGKVANCRAKVLDCLNTAISSTDRMLLVAGSSGIRRGCRQFDRLCTYANFNTLMPPNGPACGRNDSEDTWGIYPPQSYHTGGVNCGYIDGSVHFITNNVDTNGVNGSIGGGDPDYTGPSRFGVWGALGSKKESKSSTLRILLLRNIDFNFEKLNSIGFKSGL